ncbi:isocitrate lyase/phosphoenolpyruvate mutase family protein [Streptomyces sp. NRRL F-5123]|uniref:isocitrate lyase/phosphoenolpyruvate mutase family protein n=1 Tax=Streptomyces sp. NRRL F-5123 TaxID=1463856 RepID=UPI0004E1E768|nr:isocitrate lyase/phosphoenolpyruvate mutase family protein [Streptomyces sp. NRRL F-5123]
MSETAKTANSAPWTKAARLRAMLRGAGVVRAVGAHDGLTAKLVEQASFEAIWASSFEISAAYGLPDASLVSMTQYLAAAVAMDAVTQIPVIADCDTGFGGPLNVAHAVRTYERAGIAAVCIEDKLFPKMNSFADTSQDLVPTEEFALKVKSGKEAQATADFMLIARTEAFIAGMDTEQALDRAHAYEAAGADAILVHSKSRRPDQVLDFAARWDGHVPLVAVPTTYDSVGEDALHEAGFQLVIYANHGLRAAVRGVREALRDLRTAGRADAISDRIAPMADIFALQDMPSPFRANP